VIYVECKADFVLVLKVASVRPRDIVHEGGKTEVLKKLERYPDSVGLVDEDPWALQPPILRSYSTEVSLDEHGIRVLRRGKNVLIVLCPRLEEWVIGAARKSGIDPQSYGLPNRGDRLHRDINSSIHKFEKLLDDLLERGAEKVRELEKVFARILKAYFGGRRA